MSTKIITHTFGGGMNKDLDKSVLPHDTFYHAENFRLTTDRTGKKTILKTNKGMTDTEIKHAVNIPLSNYIVGYCLVRNYLVFFTTTDSGGTYSRIYKAELDDNEDLVSVDLVYNDADTVDNSRLNFSYNNRIKAFGRYESEDIINVYWCDGNNLTRRINIAINNTDDGLPYVGTNDFVSVSKLEFIDEAYLRKPVLNKLTGGNLKTGVVYYSYQFFNLNSTETLYSPLSDKISISSDSYELENASNFRGGDSGENSGKGVKLRIENDSSFNYIRLIRIYYEEYGETPTISIVKEAENGSNTYVYLTDVGNSLSELTLEDFIIYSNILFSAKEITSKNDYLLFGNINEDTFDVDYDARAYRFRTSDDTSRLYQSDGSYYIVYAAGVTRVGAGGAASLGDWEYFTSGDVYTGTNGSDWSIPDTADCINKFNELEYSASDEYKYQDDGTTIGGIGTNVEYEFNEFSDTIIIESAASSTKGDNRTGGSYVTGDSDANLLYIPQDGYDSYVSYANPFNEDIVGNFSDEVYRYGVVFGDKRGRESTVKWIGDLRMPITDDYSVNRVSRTSANINATRLSVKFTVNNFPSDALYFRIVRVRRTNSDKSIVACGFISHTFYDTTDSKRVSPVVPKLSGAGTYYGGDSPYNELLTFVSPEVNYNQYEFFQGDKLELVHVLDDYSSYYFGAGSARQSATKYNKLSNLSGGRVLLDIDDLKIIPPNVPTEDTEYTIGVAGKYIHTCRDKGADSPFTSSKGPCGTAALLDIYSNSPDIDYYYSDLSYAHSLFYCNIRREVDEGRYGGIGYYDRLANEYIPCSNRYDSSYDGIQITVYGGDCYINMFDHLRCTAHVDHGASDNTTNVTYIPVESSINLAYDHGDSFHRVRSEYNSYWIRESSGSHETISGTFFVQDRDYYLYNTVYSTENSVETRVLDSLIESDVTEFDTRVLVSERKFNNELTDSWTRFNNNNVLDIDSAYGEIINLVNFKDKVFYFQPNGFGILSINERSLISDNNTNQLVLGTGGVLDRYDYISTTSGTSSRFGVAKGKNGLYWIDENRREIYLFNGNENKVSKLKGMDSYLKGLTTIDNVEAAFDNTYDDVLFSITNNGSKENTLVYNELDSRFQPFFTYTPYLFISLNKGVLSTNQVYDKKIYKHDSSNNFCWYYADSSPSDSKLTIISNDDYPSIKVWDNVEYFSETNYLNYSSGVNKNIYSNTFSTVSFYNDYQNTDVWTLDPTLDDADSSAKEMPIKRRERNWTFVIPRNAVDKNVSTDSDIFNASNLDTTQTFKERMRSSFLYCNFVYENYNSDYYEFSIPYINVKYRISDR